MWERKRQKELAAKLKEKLQQEAADYQVMK